MIFVCLLAVCLTPQDLHQLDNFLPNPSFEQDLDRDLKPDGWSSMAFDSKGQSAWDKTTAHGGHASLSLSNPGPTGNSNDWKKCTVRWTSAEFPVAAGTTYSLAAWVRTRDVSGRARIVLSWLKGGRYLDQDASETITGTAAWKRLEVAATAPSEAQSVRVIFELTDGAGTAWFDDVQLSGASQKRPEVTYVFNDTTDWFAFELPDDDTNRDTIDLSRFLDPPAGKHGFLSVHKDGHFYFENGQRARFFGTNLGGADVAPVKPIARVLAQRFAKYGANMIRLHSLDGRSTNLINYADGTSQNLNPETLDRMDYLIAQLKQQGIYIYMDLLDYRMFRSADGVRHGDDFTHNWAGSMKGASIFDKRMIELQKDYATKLLTHRNPYTGLRYVDDPAIAVLETTNENSVFYFLLNGDLSLPFYRQQLQTDWNRWLTDQYANRAALAKAWTGPKSECELLRDEDPAAETVLLPAAELTRFSRAAMPDRLKFRMGPRRMHDVLKFFGKIQHDYNMAMRTHLKDTLGVKAPVTGTNQTFVLCDTYVNATTSDFISRNQYWRHPSRNAKPFFKFANEPMVHTDLARYRTPFSVFGGSTVVGKPMMLTEFNFPWPNEYRSEGLLLCSAYACLQDWDAVLLFSFGIERNELQMFRSRTDPARWGDFPAAALLFHRQDVSPARNEIHVAHSTDELNVLDPDQRYSPYSDFRYLTYMSKVRTAFVDGTYDAGADAVLASGRSAHVPVAEPQKVIRINDAPSEKFLYPQFVAAAKQLALSGYDHIDGTKQQFDSDTGQLSLNYQDGVFTVSTPRTQGAIGLLGKAGRLRLGALELSCQNQFAVIMVQSLSDQPLGQAKRVLVTAVGRAENTAQGFWPSPPNPKSWSPFTTWMLPAEGRAPVIAEPIHATLRLSVPGNAKIYALDPTGRRAQQLPAKYDGKTIEFDPATARSIWCEVTTNSGEALHPAN